MDSKDEQKFPKADTVRLDDQSGVEEILHESVLGLWQVVDELTRIKPVRSKGYHVTIFGSARAQPGTIPYNQVRELACGLAQLGCGIVTGGGPGLMQAANEGAVMCGLAGEENSIGIRVDLGFEQGTNPFAHQVYKHRTFFSRLHHFMLISEAFVVVPGGLGTLLELSMVWQLLQVRKLYDTPLVVMGGMWGELVNWVSVNMANAEFPMVDKKDVTIPNCVQTPEEAIRLISVHKAKWDKEQKALA